MTDLLLRIEEHLVRSYDDVRAIVLVGSRARSQYFDTNSDYDLVVVRKEKPSPASDGMFQLDGAWLGLRNPSYAGLARRSWSMLERHAYSHSKLVFDSVGDFEAVRSTKCVWSPGERLLLFCDELVKLSYHLDVTNNYKNCWNGREELLIAYNRGLDGFAENLRWEVLKHALRLSATTSEEFTPPDKALFSQWYADLCPVAASYALDPRSVIKQDVENFRRSIGALVSNSIERFENSIVLPDNIYSFRTARTRLYD